MDNLIVLIFLSSIISLIIGLIKPTAFARFISGEITRKKVAAIFGTTILVSMILIGNAADSTNVHDQAGTQPVVLSAPIVTENKTDVPASIEETPAVTPTAKKSEPKTALAPTSTSTLSATPASTPGLVKNELSNQASAVNQAKAYLKTSGFSRDGLV
ncbi:MAG: hypothetical protein CEO22_191, partial [Candidatus Berkelbacteria bacterium Gr01-1014_85]